MYCIVTLLLLLVCAGMDLLDVCMDSCDFELELCHLTFRQLSCKPEIQSFLHLYSATSLHLFEHPKDEPDTSLPTS
jgi:hypothetical protein